MEIDISIDIKEVERYLTKVEKRQIPFASALAINDTAFQAQKALKAQAPKKLDRPTKFTINAFQVSKQRATKTNLERSVFIDPKRWRYLKYQVEGGQRRARMVSLPVKQKLNKFGNIPGLRRKKRLWLKGKTTSDNQFIGIINGVNGLWQRIDKRNLKLLVAYEKEASYIKRYNFYKIVNGLVKSRFKRNLEKRLKIAIKTAK